MSKAINVERNNTIYYYSSGPLLNGQCVQADKWTTPERLYASAVDRESELKVSHAMLDLQIESHEESVPKIIKFSSKGFNSGGSLNIVTSPDQPRNIVTFNVSRTFTDTDKGSCARGWVKKLGCANVESSVRISLLISF